MYRYVGLAFLLIAFLTFIVWAISQFVQPILPPDTSSGLVLLFAALLSAVGFIAGFKDTVELLLLFPKRKKTSEIDKKYPEWDNIPASKLDVFNRLCQLSRADFEDLLFQLAIPSSKLPPYDASQASRAEKFLDLCNSRNDLGVEIVHAKIQEIKSKHVPSNSLGELALELFSRALPYLYYSLVSRNIFSRPNDFRVVDEYLDYFAKEMARRNGGDLVYVPQRVGEVKGTGYSVGEYDPDIPRGQIIKRVRQVLRLLSGVSYGGDQATAQLASINRPSRVVRNAVHILFHTHAPLVLLGDPGSGKSMTLREVGRQIAYDERRRRKPRVVVYAPLGMYRSVEQDEQGNTQPGSILELVQQSIPVEHGRLREALPKLIAENRLVVLFDGMDEMERRLYGERVRRLSKFARDYSGAIKTLFACRINDFVPEFEHRQMALLPFDRSQISEYVRKNLTFPIRIEDAEYNLPRFVNRLMERNELGDTSSNPLILFLICNYVKWHEEWPKKRAALYRSYIDMVYKKFIYSGDSPSAQSKRNSVYAGWALLAYSITSNYSGTYGEISPLTFELGESKTKQVVALGRVCGLLIPSPDDEHTVRFSHHRLQEYFTAYYLADHSAKVDWEKLLDIPLWQETFLNLVSLKPKSDVLEALEQSLRSGFDFRRIKNAEHERLIADRVVLASYVIREVGAESGILPSRFQETFVGILGALAEHGRPTSQVKMLWAWKNAPDLCPFDALTTPLRSSIGWVRDQAVMLVGALSRYRTQLGGNIGYEIAVDLANGQYFGRIPTYIQLARANTWRWLIPIYWAGVCWLFYCGIWAAISFAVISFTQDSYPLPWLAQPVAVIIIVGIVAATTAFLKRLLGSSYIHTFPYSSLITCLGVVVISKTVHESIIDALAPLLNYVPIFIGLVLGHYILFWLCLIVYSISVYPFGWKSRNLGSIVDLATASEVFGIERNYILNLTYISFWFWPVWFWILYVGLPLATRNIPLVGTIASVLFGLWIIWIMLSGIVDGIRGAIQQAQPYSHNFLSWILHFIFGLSWRLGGFLVVVVIFLTIMIAIFIPLLLGLYSEVGKNLMIYLVIGILVLCVLIMVLFLLWKSINQIALLGRQKFTPEQWMDKVSKADPETQSVYLTRTNRHNLGLGPAEFLNVLVKLEGEITEDPAASAYWRLRHELEETIRQERLEGWELDRKTET